MSERNINVFAGTQSIQLLEINFNWIINKNYIDILFKDIVFKNPKQAFA